MKTSWNLELLYKGENDPQIEKDMKRIEALAKSFERKYKNTLFIQSPNTLFSALQEYEKDSHVINEAKPWWYFALKSDLNSSDSKISAKKNYYFERYTQASNRIKFFELTIAQISKEDQKVFLNSPILKPYQYYLQRIFSSAQYNLTEKEEQLTGLLTQTSRDMWIDSQNKLLQEQTIFYKGKKVSIQEALSKISVLPKKERRVLHQKVYEIVQSISYLAEAEINAIYNFKKVMDERRGFLHPYSDTILNYENDENTIISFVDLVTKNFHISQRFYKLHARLLGEKKLHRADRQVLIGTIKRKFDFVSAVSLVRKGFDKFGSEYSKIFDTFLQNGQVDVKQKVGKRGGAYSWGNKSLPTFVLLNHSGTLRSVETLAHEMGHSFHTYFSKKNQPPRYQSYTSSTAEVASTFFENLVHEEIEKELTEKERIILLHNKILGDVTTIFTQIACFNFELELHREIRKNGYLSAKEIARIMQKHLKSYMGSAVETTSLDGYFFVLWSHIRRHFYVYSYAYGQLISKALYEKWKENPSFATQIEKFLSAGGSMSPEDIFKSIGIDTSNMSFFKTGLKAIEKDIDLLEKLTKGKKL